MRIAHPVQEKEQILQVQTAWHPLDVAVRPRNKFLLSADRPVQLAEARRQDTLAADQIGGTNAVAYRAYGHSGQALYVGTYFYLWLWSAYPVCGVRRHLAVRPLLTQT